MALLTPLTEAIRETGFAFVSASTMRRLLGSLADWAVFAASWDALGPDTFMADGGRYRKRRFAVFRASADGIANGLRLWNVGGHRMNILDLSGSPATAGGRFSAMPRLRYGMF